MHEKGSPKTYALDIETVSQGLRANEYTDKKSYKLGNVKDEEKVAKALKKKQEEARGKHGLHWTTGKVCSVALVSICGEDSIVISGYDEKTILEELAPYLDGDTIIGKSSEGFDAPFLIGRYMDNRIKVPRSLKPSARLAYDVDKFFGFSASSGQRGSLDAYAHGLGLESKTMHGSMVQGVYDTAVNAKMEMDTVTEDAAWQQIRDYNLGDSIIVKEMVLLFGGVN
jgi:hypothetical protein